MVVFYYSLVKTTVEYDFVKNFTFLLELIKIEFQIEVLPYSRLRFQKFGNCFIDIRESSLIQENIRQYKPVQLYFVFFGLRFAN